MRNIYKDDHKYSLEIRPRTLVDKPLLSKAKLKMEMASPIYNAWKRGGYHAKSITYNPFINPRKVEFCSWDGRLEDICMNGEDFEKVTMTLDFQSPATLPGETYTFDLIQKDEQGNIVGGETFVVEAPIYSYKPIDIIPVEVGGGKYQLSADWQGTDYLVHWTDKNGEDIGEGSKVTVIPTLRNKEFSVTAISSQGEMAQKSITLESKTGIKSVAPSLVEDYIYVVLDNPVDSKNAVLQVSSLSLGGTILLSKSLPTGTKEMRLDATSLSSGIYILYYSVDGQIIDSQKINKK